jgi:hypothetical protein
MLAWLKLSHIDHSGRLRPHEHTSYVPLGILLLIVGVVLAAYSVSAASPPPESGSVGLTGEMPGPPPSTAATISKPTDGQRFGTSPITVSGTCPKDTLVELFKNDIFAGSTFCSKTGTYTLDIDLLFGKNILIARVYDALNQSGPDSNAVTVFYDALPPESGPLSPLDFIGAQLVLNTDAVYRGVFPQKSLNVPISILGGTPPYALNVQWGDSTNKLVSRHDNIPFDVDHAYSKPGTYQIALQASDTVGRVAFLSVAAIVNGQPAAAPATASASPVNQLLLLWPLYVSAIAAVVSFWLGERREKHVLSKRGLLLAPPS